MFKCWWDDVHKSCRPLSWRHESGYGQSFKKDRITSRLAEGGTSIVMAVVWP